MTSPPVTSSDTAMPATVGTAIDAAVTSTATGATLPVCDPLVVVTACKWLSPRLRRCHRSAGDSAAGRAERCRHLAAMSQHSSKTASHTDDNDDSRYQRWRVRVVATCAVRGLVRRPVVWCLSDSGTRQCQSTILCDMERQPRQTPGQLPTLTRTHSGSHRSPSLSVKPQQATARPGEAGSARRIGIAAVTCDVRHLGRL